MEVLFQPLHVDVLPPQQATSGSAGHDLRAYLASRRVTVIGDRGVEERSIDDSARTLIIRPGERALVPLGFKATLPRDYEAAIRIRSSIAFERGLIVPNSPATIDSDFPGEWVVMVANITNIEAAIRHGERFAQVVFSRFYVADWRVGTVVSTTGRTGGAGSTGVD